MKRSTNSKRTNRSISQADLARELGVTQVTVHRALRGLPGVGRELRRRILDLAYARRYRIKATARAAATGRSHAICLLLGVATETSALPPDLLRGILRGTEQAGYRLVIAEASDEQLCDETFIPQLIAEASSDGILIDYTHRVPSRMIELIDHYRIPCVFINCKRSIDAVYPDDLEAGRRACRALIEAGHRHIAYVGPAPEQPGVHYSVRDRYEGYLSEMCRAGLTPRAVLHRWGSGWEADLATVWSLIPRPTAFITYSMPWELLLMAADRGLRCPSDFALVTFSRSDDRLAAGGTTVSHLTIPMGEVGRQAARVLLGKVEQTRGSMPAMAIRFGDLKGETCVAAANLRKRRSRVGEIGM